VNPHVPTGVPFGGNGATEILAQANFLHFPSGVGPPFTFVIFESQPFGHFQCATWASALDACIVINVSAAIEAKDIFLINFMCHSFLKITDRAGRSRSGCVWLI
jgi:hypothetical protein